MGGWGSGDWPRYGTKATVESCFALVVNRLARDGIFRPCLTGSIIWHDPRTGEQSAAVSFTTLPAERDGLYLALSYTVDGVAVEMAIRLEHTVPHFGGRRWWARCPLVVDGVACRRRVAKLHLRGQYFGCRHCHGLAYWSAQKAHSAERLESRDRQLTARLAKLTAEAEGRRRGS